MDEYVDNDSREQLTSPNGNHKPSWTKAITFPLAITTFAGSLGMFSFGYEISALNSIEPVVEQWINRSYADRGASWTNNTANNHVIVPGIPPEKQRLLFSVTVAIFALGGMFGSLLAGRMADRLGRRRANIVNAMLTLVAAPLMAISGWAKVPELLIIGRFLIGVSNGAATVLSPMYLIESAPVAIRGGIGICTQLSGVSGIFCATLFGLPPLFGTTTLWPMVFIMAAIMPATQLVLLILLCQESPRYMYISKRDPIGAERVLQRLRRRQDVGDELRELEYEMRANQNATVVGVRGLFRERRYLWPLVVALVVHVSQQFSGTNGILAYSGVLFQQAGLTASESAYASLSIGVILFVTAIGTVALIERLGRKFLDLFGIIGSSIICGLLITIFSAIPVWFHVANAMPFNIITIVLVLIFVAIFGIGPASIPWVVVGELFDQSSRSSATSLVCAVNWISQLITFVIFPAQQAALGVYVFLPHVIIEVVCVAFLIKYMPETSGRSIEEIVETFEPRRTSTGRTANNIM